MPKIHIATPDGRQEIIEEFQLHAKAQSGTIPAGSLYWKEGMANWQPVAELIPAATPAPSSGTSAAPAPPADPNAPFNPYAAPTVLGDTSAGLPPGHYAFTKNPLGITRVLTIFLGLCILANVLAVFSDIAQYILVSRPYTPAEAEVNDTRQAAMGGIYSLAYFPTFVIFGMWIYRAAVNSRGFGALGMRDGPGWSVGWYFIPIMNLFRPYQCMKEIWQVSGNPRDWENQSGSGLLVAWWTLWLVSNVFDNISTSMGMGSDTTTAAMQSSTLVSIASSLVGIALAVVAMKLVRAITRRQQALVAASAE